MSSSPKDQEKPHEELESPEPPPIPEPLKERETPSIIKPELEENKEEHSLNLQNLPKLPENEDNIKPTLIPEESTADGYYQGSPMDTIPTDEARASSIQGDFISESVLLLNNEKHEVHPINHRYRCLKLSENKLLFTGPAYNEESCFIYDLSSRESKKHVARLNKPRELHAMSEIDGKVAVIGGLDASGVLDSVEVLENNTFRPIQTLNHPRYGLSATTHRGITWVVGGASSKTTPENTIEYYQNNCWTLLQISQKLDRVGAGLTSFNNRLLILGGFMINKEETRSVLTFDPVISEKITLLDAQDLDFPCCFSLNLWNPEGSKLLGYSFLGKQVEYMPR